MWDENSNRMRIIAHRHAVPYRTAIFFYSRVQANAPMALYSC